MYALTILPGILILFVVWKFDTVEKEPPALLAKLFLGGALTVITAVLLGLAGDLITRRIAENPRSFVCLLFDSFLFTALVEEAGFFLILWLLTWKNRAFNYTFDGIIYAVAVTVGFSTVENLIFAIRTDSAGCLTRILLSLLGHVIFGIFMGYYYGLARNAKGAGDDRGFRRRLVQAILLPTVLHGFYVFCLRAERIEYTVFLAVYMIVLTAVTVWQFLKFSREDTLIPGMEWTVSVDESTWEEESNEDQM